MVKLQPSLGVRLDKEMKKSLEKAAAADDRTTSSLIRKILLEWLRRRKLVE